MIGVKTILSRLARAYALWGALLVLLGLPGALLRIGTTRERPVRLESIPAPDGSLGGTVLADGRTTRFSAISIGGGPWVPAGGVVAARSLFDLPAGTPVAFREAGAGARVVTGAVRERRSTVDESVTRATFALLGVALALAGAGIALAGVGLQALLAGAALAGLGHFVGARFLEANASLVQSTPLREAIVLVWVSFPRHFAFPALAAFLSLFPSDLTRSRACRVLLGLLGATALAQALLVPLFQVPGTLDSLGTGTQAFLLGGTRRLTSFLFGAGSLGGLLLFFFQARALRMEPLSSATRRRASVIGAGLLVGLGPPLAAALAQIAWIAGTGRLLLPPVAIALSLLPVLILPLVLAYAMLSPRVLSVGLLVKKAILLAFAEGSVRVVSLAPLAALGLLFWTRREVPIGEVFSSHALFICAALAATTAGLRYGDRTRSLLERLFFDARKASSGTLASLAGEARRARDVEELAEAFSGGIERALVAEPSTLFVRDDRTGSFVSPGRPLPALDGTSPIVEAAALRPGPIRLDGDAAGFADLSEMDRNWLAASRARILVPLTGSTGGLLALLAVGEKASERPFDPEDEQFLSAAASAGALALENLLLRSSQASSAGPSHAGRPTDAIEAPEAARLCRRCRRLFPSDAGSACPDDETFFETVPAPYLLAGKYRLERWVGAGGMGVVYKARDLALGRDVAVKTLPSLSAGSVRRLQREARAGAQLIHPSLGLIFALESWHGTPMLVLEYLPGGTLADRIRSGPVAPALAAAWGAALASGLEALHARGVLHRDLKPSNVGFAADGAPKLLDFGLVRLLGETDASFAPGVPPDLRGARGETDSSTRTAASHVVGTVPYLSPEALQGHPPSPGFDLWGLSLTIYEALTGVNPFAASSSTRTAERVLTLPVPDPRGYRPDCPGSLAAVLLAALARDERVRPATARSLREAFEGAGRGLPSISGESPSLRARDETFPGPAPTA